MGFDNATETPAKNLEQTHKILSEGFYEQAGEEIDAKLAHTYDIIFSMAIEKNEGKNKCATETQPTDAAADQMPDGKLQHPPRCR
jgi:hypothetical protein